MGGAESPAVDLGVSPTNSSERLRIDTRITILLTGPAARRH
jgi:hypothetical protein